MDMKSQQHTVGAILICFLMILTVATTSNMVHTNTIKADEGNQIFSSLGSYDIQAEKNQFGYYKQITINHSQVDENLVNFPILIHLSTDADLASKCLPDGSDISFFDASNELNFEIERYISGTGELIAWVNVTSISSSEDTIIYIYYNDSDIGASPQNAPGVWANNYLAVHHGTDLNNSVDGGNLSVSGGPVSVNDTTSPIIGGYWEFENDDTAYLFNNSFHNYSDYGNLTLESWADIESIGSTGDLRYTSTVACGYSLTKAFGCDLRCRLVTLKTFQAGLCDGSGCYSSVDDKWEFAYNTWYYIAGVFNTTGSALYWNGTLNYTNWGNTVDWTTFSSEAVQYGAKTDLPSYLDGAVDEARISSVVRSDGWISTTHNSQKNGTGGDNGFFVLGAEQENSGGASSFSIVGLPNNRITFSGIAGATVYCNDTGDTNDWVEINMSINSTDNVSEIRVFVGDFNDTSDWINASNITLYVADSGNSTYYSYGTFTDGGSNISINKSTWDTYMGIENPFNDTGLKDIDTSIFCIFKMTVPNDAITSTFWSSASDSFKIYLGYFS